MSEILSDFPKLQTPFIRQTFKINKNQFKQARAQFHLRQPEVYLVVNRINPGYEWVFEDKDTIAVEKLDGTNIKIKTQNGRLISVQNRKNVIDPLVVIGGKGFIMEGLFQAIDKGYVKEDGEQAGELIGPKVQANPYKLGFHLWYSFEKAVNSLRYKSFNEHECNFDNWSSWFRDYLFSRFYAKAAAKEQREDKIFAEGVVFYNLKRKASNQVWMAKLRRDMFNWYYEGIEIYDYTENGINF
ncbi:MAG: RNA ligase family protein [Candidatus Omnitrophota bacterium]|nr:RNA ligase family protein [Candidatus Omnitrophota bacterium]